MKAAIYARYSTDMQSDASIEDQISICDRKAVGENWQVVGNYSDHAMSGASMMRPGIQQLMQDAAAGKFELVIAEALDRLSRDQEDIAAIYKRLSFAGVTLFTLAEGEISQLHIGLKGTMNALFLKDLADKTRRGLRGRVEKGKSGGGLTYGYDVVSSSDERGERTINGHEAAVVRRIFEEYLSGKSPRAIAQQLNKDAIAGPSGKGWGPSTIYGNRQRGTGILNNELYIGRLIWNRLRYMKDPQTGKRVSRLNAEEDWVIQEVPELRIIDQGLWDRVKAKQGEFAPREKPFWAKQRPRNLFSYLVKCGECGGGCSMVSQTHLGCSNARNKGTCDNRLTIAREVLEEDVLGALRERLMEPELCEVFCREYTEHMNRLRINEGASLAAYKRELDSLERERQRIVQSIKDGVPAALLKDDATRIAARIEELDTLLATTEEPEPLLHPNMTKRYHEQVQNLIGALNEPDHRAEAAQIVRSLIDKIVLRPFTNGRRLIVDLHGDLAGILAMASGDEELVASSSKELKHIKLLTGGDARASVGYPPMQDKMVAGVHNHLELLKQDKAVAGPRNQLFALYGKVAVIQRAFLHSWPEPGHAPACHAAFRGQGGVCGGGPAESPLWVTLG